MALLRSMSQGFRRASLPYGGRRGMASDAHHDPPVSWSEYRSGKKTLSEWIDANRPIVVVGTLAGYVALIKLFGGGKKKKNDSVTVEAEVVPAK
mmetsp:Transcript_5743/g.11406  ORF Transcript_5743/g.11406 Transcript_5743/m.11406 type:complete len:94 (-) Transcript_5743:184-465(-)|eukprot:CAMPEP_0184681070 /NCGR_PEP_ID=MMETSP0312-20130426/4031_1 /TAXON_ID=31354 /ORGANISM="Compsopogon coeruleus, Strain SAG 36.94" /LENGTH=93 /DNA_ID=CAMNT_0027131665 /DNA_START=62 /DNA_END=343 /DNA_ORIENTATION=-